MSRNGKWMCLAVLAVVLASVQLPCARAQSYRLGDTAAEVETIQKALTELELYYADITGHYSSKTETAVRLFQKKYSLRQTGVADELTLRRLYDAADIEAPQPGEDGGAEETAATVRYLATLRQGSQGSDVRQLQSDLEKLGYYHGTITGHFGGMTRDAVRRFQRKHGLSADGIAGPMTLSRIASELGRTTPQEDAGQSNPGTTAGTGTLRFGSRGDEVRALQKNLDRLGYYDGTITGSYGRLTQDAVFRFQRENSLSADGIAGKNTLARLAALIEKKYGGEADGEEPDDAEPDEETDELKLNAAKTLRYGDRSDDVKRLQQVLEALDYYDSGVTGYYGSQTEASVKAYQRAKKLKDDGIAGPKTLAALNDSYARFLKGEDSGADKPAAADQPDKQTGTTVIDIGHSDN